MPGTGILLRKAYTRICIPAVPGIHMIRIAGSGQVSAASCFLETEPAVFGL